MSVTPRSLQAYKTVWSAERNEDLYLSYAQSLRAEDSAPPAFTGDFNADYLRICEEFNICPHPQLIKKKNTPAKEGEDQKVDGKKEEEKKKTNAKKKKREEDDLKAPVEHLQVYGWRFDLGTAAALSAILPTSRSLTSIRLWAAQCHPQALHVLAEGLKESTIQKLHLEFNPLQDEDESMNSFRRRAEATAAAARIHDEKELPPDELSPRDDSSDYEEPPTSVGPSDIERDSRPVSRTSTAAGRSRPYTPNTEGGRQARSQDGLSRQRGEAGTSGTGFNFLLDQFPRVAGSCLVELCSSPNLQMVSLRANKITDDVACQLFRAFQDAKCSLISLNLWNNLIGDESMPDLVQLLLVTRTLTAISLGQNRITEEGAIMLGHAFKAVTVDKEEAKRLKRDGLSVTVAKTKAFRDANTTVRFFNISRNDLTDLACESWLELCDEETASGMAHVDETKAKSEEKKSKKKPSKAEHGRGNRLEKIVMSKNDFGRNMHLRLHLEPKVEVQPLPADMQAKLDAENAANAPPPPVVTDDEDH